MFLDLPELARARDPNKPDSVLKLCLLPSSGCLNRARCSLTRKVNVTNIINFSFRMRNANSERKTVMVAGKLRIAALEHLQGADMAC